MGRFLLIILALAMVAPVAQAGRKKAKAGEIKENVYTDAKYGFRLTLHENWKPRINDADDAARLVLTQRNYAIPTKYKDAPDYTKIPRLVVYVDTTSMSAPVFIDSLISPDFKSKQKSAILGEFEFLQEKEIAPKGKARIELAGTTGFFWKGQSKYMKEIVESVSATTGKREYGNYGGAIYAVNRDQNIILFHFMCEWEFYETVMTEVESMIKSIEFIESES